MFEIERIFLTIHIASFFFLGNVRAPFPFPLAFRKFREGNQSELSALYLFNCMEKGRQKPSLVTNDEITVGKEEPTTFLPNAHASHFYNGKYLTERTVGNYGSKPKYFELDV